MNTYDKEKIIFEATSYFLKQIEDNEIHILKNTILPKIDEKSTDFLDSSYKTLIKAQDILERKILNRTVGDLQKTVEETINNLEILIKEIRLHDSLIVEPDKNTMFDTSVTQADRKLLLQSGKKVQSDSMILLNAPKNFKVTKRDIIKLTYYELSSLYHNAEYANFKTKAIETIKRQFDFNLTGDKLEISLTKISSQDNTKQLSIPKEFPQKKLHSSTFKTTI